MSWADFTSQKHVYAAQTQQLAEFRLGVIRDAANAFLELDRAHAVLEIQQRNRALTVRNLETSRARIAAGWSSETEVLRWDSQLAANDRDIAQAKAAVLVGRFALNSVRNLPREAPIAARAATIDDYGFVYANDAIVEAIATPDGDRRLRDLLVREGRARARRWWRSTKPLPHRNASSRRTSACSGFRPWD